MRLKWILAVSTFALLIGCTPAYVPKTADQIQQEVQDEMISKMRQRGESQADIDRQIAYSKLSYADQLKESIKPSWNSSDPSESMVSLIEHSLNMCDLQRNSLKLQLGSSFATKASERLVQCVATAGDVVRDYYYKEYIKSSSPESLRSAADETYLKWNGYVDSILQGSPSYMQEQSSLSLKSQAARFYQLSLREALSKQKK